MKIDVDRIFMRLGIMETKGFETRIVLKRKSSAPIIGHVTGFFYDEDDTKVEITLDDKSTLLLYLSKIKEVDRADRYK